MRKPLLILGVLLAAGLAAFLLSRSRTDHHGKPFRELPEVTLQALLDRPGDYLRKDVRVSGSIARQCPATGCWFFLKAPDGRELKVELGDTLPRLPQHVGGTAVVEGQLIPFGTGTEFIGTAVEFH